MDLGRFCSQRDTFHALYVEFLCEERVLQDSCGVFHHLFSREGSIEIMKRIAFYDARFSGAAAGRIRDDIIGS